MSGPQGAGTFGSLLDTAPVFTGENSEDFSVNAGTWDWDLLASQWLITDLGDANYTISGGELHGTNVNAQVLADDVRASSRKMWGSVENREDLTTGFDRQFRVYINFSRFANTTGSSAGYWVSFGRSGTKTFIAIGKTWNGTDTTYQLQYNPIPVGAVIRIRHDGLGLITADIDEEDRITYIDTCFLRARGGGMGWSVSFGDISVDNLQFGILAGGIGIPVPWYQGDTCDTNLIGSLWTQSAPGSWPAYSSTFNSQYGPAYWQSSGTTTTHTLKLTDTSLLLGDCFCEATLERDESVRDCYITLRGNSTLTQGYYFRWTGDAGGKFQIGKHGVGELASLAAASPGTPYRMRAEAQGNTLRLFQQVGGVWVLKVSTTDATYSAGDILLAFNDVFSQGIPWYNDIVVGNIATSVSCTVERLTYDTTSDEAILFNIIFSEEVTGFSGGDVTLSGSASAGCAVSIAGSGRSYTATVTGMSTAGEVILDVNASSCTAVTHGASNSASTSLDNSVTFDGVIGTFIARTLSSSLVSNQHTTAVQINDLIIGATAYRSAGAGSAPAFAGSINGGAPALSPSTIYSTVAYDTIGTSRGSAALYRAIATATGNYTNGNGGSTGTGCHVIYRNLANADPIQSNSNVADGSDNCNISLPNIPTNKVIVIVAFAPLASGQSAGENLQPAAPAGWTKRADVQHGTLTGFVWFDANTPKQTFTWSLLAGTTVNGGRRVFILELA